MYLYEHSAPLQPQLSHVCPEVSSPTTFLLHLGQAEYHAGFSSPPCDDESSSFETTPRKVPYATSPDALPRSKSSVVVERASGSILGPAPLPRVS
eukprot:jgi/Chrpa1/25105/Chrysochromulina_OHIO_Genome00014027-RA